MISFYILELSEGYYYVGQTDRLELRLADHRSGTGSKWTRLYPPIRILKSTTRGIADPREAVLYENWLTLHTMQRYGWQKVRGGDYLDLEDYRIRQKIGHIFDTDANRIRVFIPDCPYLFGASHDWLVFVLALEHGYFYIGSGKRLGKLLGDHFIGGGNQFTRLHRPLKVAEWHVIKDGAYLSFKKQLADDYRARYGAEQVMAGNQ